MNLNVGNFIFPFLENCRPISINDSDLFSFEIAQEMHEFGIGHFGIKL